MKRFAISSLIGALTIGVTLPTHARDAFQIDLTVSNPTLTQTGSRGYSTVENAINTLSSTAALQSLAPSYLDTLTFKSKANAQINLRGLSASAIFTQNSTALTVNIPGVIDKTFAGATRADSANLFLRFIEGQGASSSLFRALASSTPGDPVAGNPNALMNQMVSSDFGRALDDAAGTSPPGLGLEARYGSFSAAGLNSQSFSLPLDYSWRISERDAIDLDVPLSTSDTGGGQSYSGNIGVLWRHRVLTNWTLQPSVRIGGVGSTDLGSAAGVWSVGLNSAVKFDLPAAWQLTVGNGLTYISTIPITVGNFSVNYDLQNVVFRNGILVSHDLGFEVWNHSARGSLYAIDTRFTGDAVYMSSYQEFGGYVTVGAFTPVNLGVSYLVGDHGVHGFSVATGVKF